jgi:hypothetical protein
MTSSKTGAAPTVYLCTAQTELAALEPIGQWLQAQGLTTELVREPLDKAAIGLAQVFVYRLSASSAESLLCRQALDAALAADLPILIINPDLVAIPEQLSTPLRYAHLIDSSTDLNPALYAEILRHLPSEKEQPLSKPAMPDFPENQRASLIQHSLVALAILLLGILIYFLFRT